MSLILLAFGSGLFSLAMEKLIEGHGDTLFEIIIILLQFPVAESCS